MIKTLYRKSRWLHKILGLILIPFLIWMSISGIILNHPELVDQINVPAWMIPEHYKIKNWNRSSIIGAVQSVDNTTYLFGKKGVWRVSASNSIDFLGRGFPQSAFYQKTNHMVLLNRDKDSLLLAATDGGLYFSAINNGQWRRIDLPGKPEKLKKILMIQNDLLIIGESNFYCSSLTNFSTTFLSLRE